MNSRWRKLLTEGVTLRREDAGQTDTPIAVLPHCPGPKQCLSLRRAES